MADIQTNKISDQRRRAGPVISAICGHLIQGLVTGHDAYLKMAGHGAMGVPESYLQVHVANKLSGLYQTPYHVWLEPSFRRLGIPANHRRRVDIAIVRKRRNGVIVPRIIIEVKRAVSSDVIGNDLDRLAAIKAHATARGRMIACVMLCYHVAATPDSLYNGRDTVLEDRQDTRARFFCFDPKETIRKNGETAYYQPLCFRV